LSEAWASWCFQRRRSLPDADSMCMLASSSLGHKLSPPRADRMGSLSAALAWSRLGHKLSPPRAGRMGSLSAALAWSCLGHKLSPPRADRMGSLPAAWAWSRLGHKLSPPRADRRGSLSAAWAWSCLGHKLSPPRADRMGSLSEALACHRCKHLERLRTILGNRRVMGWPCIGRSLPLGQKWVTPPKQAQRKSSMSQSAS